MRDTGILRSNFAMPAATDGHCCHSIFLYTTYIRNYLVPLAFSGTPADFAMTRDRAVRDIRFAPFLETHRMRR